MNDEQWPTSCGCGVANYSPIPVSLIYAELNVNLNSLASGNRRWKAHDSRERKDLYWGTLDIDLGL